MLQGRVTDMSFKRSHIDHCWSNILKCRLNWNCVYCTMYMLDLPCLLNVLLEFHVAWHFLQSFWCYNIYKIFTSVFYNFKHVKMPTSDSTTEFKMVMLHIMICCSFNTQGLTNLFLVEEPSFQHTTYHDVDLNLLQATCRFDMFEKPHTECSTLSRHVLLYLLCLALNSSLLHWCSHTPSQTML